MISDFDEERVRLRQENKEREKKQKQVELRLKRMQAFQARSELQEVDTEGDIFILFQVCFKLYILKFRYCEKATKI